MGRGFFTLRFRRRLVGFGLLCLAVLLSGRDKTLPTQPSSKIAETSLVDAFVSEKPLMADAGQSTKEDFVPSISLAQSDEKSEKEVCSASISTEDGVKNGEFIINDSLRAGESIFNLATRHGVKKSEVFSAVSVLSKAVNPRKIRVGQVFTLRLKYTDGQPELQSLVMDNGFAGCVEVLRSSKGFVLHQEAVKTVHRDIAVCGVIKNHFNHDAATLGVPSKIIEQVKQAVGGKVDFRRDLASGVKFEMVYDVVELAGKSLKKLGDLKYISFLINGKCLKVYGMNAGAGHEYYDQNGVPTRGSYLRLPIDGGRVTSGYGVRMHPVSGYYKKHKGIDIAARLGTPIKAAASGRLRFVGRKSGYGLVVCIEHPSGYSTLYAHMRRFADGVRAGRDVVQGQVIGFVGMTGSTTGPHVHVEVLKNGVNLNPLKVGMMPKSKLSGRQLQNFRQLQNSISRAISEKSI